MYSIENIRIGSASVDDHMITSWENSEGRQWNECKHVFLFALWYSVKDSNENIFKRNYFYFDRC